jgi:hypothetical protein
MASIVAIVLASFLAGVAFDRAYPLFVRWIDGREPIAVKRRAAPSDFPGTLKAIVDLDSEPNAQLKPQPHRRIGLAELRRRAEVESLKPVAHQARVTENNAKAMEGK